jgi:DNA modification methylase
MPAKSPAKKIRTIRDLSPDAVNANRGTDRGRSLLDTSLEKYGAGRSVLVDRRGVLIAGNKTVERAAESGLKDVIVVQSDGQKLVVVQRIDLDMQRDTRARELAIADNRTNELGLDWDPEVLASLISKHGVETALFFTERELRQLMSGIPNTALDLVPEPEIGRAAELQRKWQVRRGDIWEIGNHRLLCGDSTNASDVAGLIDNERAAAAITDPPYSVNYQNLRRKPHAPTRREMGDAYKDPPAEEVLKFIELIPSDVLVMSYPVNKHFHLLSDMTREWDLLYDCVWVKHHFAFIIGRHYQPQHEPVLVFRRKGGKGVFNVPTNQSTIFEFDKPARNPDHPTIKPVELYEVLVQNHSNRNDIIYEPFSGSGTTIAACEITNRRAYAMETEPTYCAVTLERLASMGLKPHRLKQYRPTSKSKKRR